MIKLVPFIPFICLLSSDIDGVGQSKDSCQACPIYILDGENLIGSIYADTTIWYEAPESSAYYQLYAIG